MIRKYTQAAALLYIHEINRFVAMELLKSKTRNEWKEKGLLCLFFRFFVFYATNLEQNKKRSLTDCSEQGYIGQKWGTEVYYVIWSYWSQSEAAKSKRPTQKKKASHIGLQKITAYLILSAVVENEMETGG